MPYPFSDLVATPDLQRMLDTFESASGISTQIMDMDGEIIVASSSRSLWHEFPPETLQARQRPGKNTFHSNEETTQRDEAFGGLLQYSRVIRIEDGELGTLVLGPVFHTQPLEATFHKLAQEFGFGATKYLETL